MHSGSWFRVVFGGQVIFTLFFRFYIEHVLLIALLKKHCCATCCQNEVRQGRFSRSRLILQVANIETCCNTQIPVCACKVDVCSLSLLQALRRFPIVSLVSANLWCVERAASLREAPGCVLYHFVPISCCCEGCLGATIDENIHVQSGPRDSDYKTMKTLIGVSGGTSLEELEPPERACVTFPL